VSKIIYRAQYQPKAESEALVRAAIGGTEGLLEAVGFDLTKHVHDEQARMPDRSKFQIEWAATLKPRKAKTSVDLGNRLQIGVGGAHRERAGIW